ncbi:MAG: hypothetical protein LBD04_08525 [Synergistaceae bacterium]|jgi:hypothetical protein|nr:hypothetical protein [Synergistaceae bacterium]
MDERKSPAFPGLTGDLSGFWKALLEQHQERRLTLKRVVDDDLADMITARRMEVEGIVHDLRRSAAMRLAEGLEANRRAEDRQKRACEAEIQEVFSRLVEEELRRLLEGFRRLPKYRDVMEALAKEALEVLPSPSAVLVEKGDGVFLPPWSVFREVREELEGVWGGLILVGDGRIVDNTFRTRGRSRGRAPRFGGFVSNEGFCL